MNIYAVSVKDSELTKEGIAQIIDMIKEGADNHFWDSGEDYLSWGMGQKGTTYLELNLDGTPELNGCMFADDDPKPTVPYSIWFPAVIAELEKL